MLTLARRYHDGRIPGVLAALALVALCSTLAMAEPVGDPATGLAVDPPAGYQAKSMTPPAPYTAVIDVKTAADTDTGCRVAFAGAPQNARLSQEQINDFVGKPEWTDLVRASLGIIYETRGTEPFDHAGVRGVALVADIKPTPDIPPRAQDIRTLFVILEIPKGRTTIVCVGEKATFDTRRAEFEQIARGVTLPR